MLRCRRLIRSVSDSIRTYTSKMPVSTSSQGDLENTSAARPHVLTDLDPEYKYRSLAIAESDDDPKIRKTYRPFLLDKSSKTTDWIEELELATVTKMAMEDIQRTSERLKVLVLFGSLRPRFVDRSASTYLLLHPMLSTMTSSSNF